MTHVRVFAAAAEAVGVTELGIDVVTVSALRAQLSGMGPEAPRVIAQCAVLRGGARLDDDASLAPGDLVDVLPPFAGG